MGVTAGLIRYPAYVYDQAKAKGSYDPRKGRDIQQCSCPEAGTSCTRRSGLSTPCQPHIKRRLLFRGRTRSVRVERGARSRPLHGVRLSAARCRDRHPAARVFVRAACDDAGRDEPRGGLRCPVLPGAGGDLRAAVAAGDYVFIYVA